MLLNECKKGEGFEIMNIVGIHDVRNRLMALGLIPGKKGEVVGCAPLGDPIVVRIDEALISLRINEAKNVQVEKVKA